MAPGRMSDVEAPSMYPQLELQTDGRSRVIDIVLVYKEDGKQNIRSTYQDNLRSLGLNLQLEKSKEFETNARVFVKIHAPTSVLIKQADILHMKKSVRINLGPNEEKLDLVPGFMKPKLSDAPRCLKAEFRQEIADLFVSEGETLEDIFTSSERIEIVWDMLTKCKFGDGDKQIGIRKLLNDETYSAAFPLHDGPHIKPENKQDCSCINNREQLYQEWARPGAWYKAQPLDLVREYFGDEIGIYFAWLGFYTVMLVPAAIVGIICFVYGLATYSSNFATTSREICDTTSPGAAGNFTLCPTCLNGDCPVEVLGDSCVYAQLTYLFDNPATVAFAIFMSFWATMFLELWKRRQARLASRWGLGELQLDMQTRPEFDVHVTTTQINKFTGKEEPALTFWSKALRLSLTISGVLFMVAVVVIAFIGIIVYKISVAAALYALDDEFFKNNSEIVTSVTASIINLILILLLGMVYKKFAKWLTQLECPRTQTDYDNSFTFKIFIFEFINCYSILFYIAFFKGKFFTYPGDDEMWSSFFGIAGDQCDPAGCISELFIQLIVIMVGKQIFNNSMEIGIPLMKRIWCGKQIQEIRKEVQWEQDLALDPVGSLSLFDEILEMVLQYGFLTLFVAAFPLAPLFALLNNIIEIRLDAFKWVTQMRRPVPKRAASLGAWFNILQTTTFLAVVTNAFVIAYTSEFIPQIVYMMTKSPDGSLKGYMNFTLSVFDTADYESDNVGLPDTCRYRGFRSPPSDTGPEYELTSDYWNVLAARLAFVVVFEHVVMAISGMIAALIPDLPWDVKEKTYLEMEMLAQQTQQRRDQH